MKSKIALLTAVAFCTPAWAADADASDKPNDETIIVTGQRPATVLDGQATLGALGNLKPLDTPFSLTTVDAAEIANRQALTIGDVLRGDPSVTPSSNGVQNESTFVVVRGFTISGFRNSRIDGLPFYVASSDTPLEAFERVELLRGLSGFLYGFTAPGGVINYVTKKPTDTTQLGIDVGYVSRGLGRASADLSGPFDEGGRVAYRLNGAIENGETFTRDTYLRRESGSAALRFRPADDITVDLNYIDSFRHQDGDLFGILVPTTVVLPAPVSGSKRIAQPYTYYETHLKSGGARAAWTFAPAWTVTADVRQARLDRTFRDTFLTLTSSAGNYTETNSNIYQNYGGTQGQLLIDGKVATGPLTHEIAAGGSLLDQSVNRNKTAPSVVLGSGNLANPGLFPNIRPALIVDTYRQQNLKETAGFVADTISWGEAIKLIAGARYTHFEQDDYGFNVATQVRARTRAYDKTPVTPSVALVVKPRADISLYASYVQSLEPGGTAPATAVNAAEVFGPLKSKQYEAGAKAELGAFALTAAVFRIEKGLEYLNPANVYVQDGIQRHEGVEFQFNGSPVAGLDLAGGVTFLDADVRRAAAAVTGKTVQSVAERQASLLADWTLPGLPAVALTGSVQYVGKRPVDALNVNYGAGYTIGSAGLRYLATLGGKPVNLRLSVENLTDKKYWNTNFGYVYPGPPRNVRLSIGTKF